MGDEASTGTGLSEGKSAQFQPHTNQGTLNQEGSSDNIFTLKTTFMLQISKTLGIILSP